MFGDKILFFSSDVFSNFVISGAKYDYGQLRRQIMKSRSDGKDWWRWSRSVQKDFKPTAHFPAFIDTLSCNLVLGIALFWWKESRTMLSLDHASSIIEWKYCSWLFSSNKREVITQGKSHFHQTTRIPNSSLVYCWWCSVTKWSDSGIAEAFRTLGPVPPYGRRT